MTGFVVFGHGSRVESANEAVRLLANRMAREAGHTVEPAFLELGQPDLSDAVGRLRSRGASRVIVIPYFLTLGTHLQRDLPRLAVEAMQLHGVPISITPPLDGHPALLQALLDRAAMALSEAK
jgi:sirohydrochlorin ferrochelatase